MQPAGDRGLPDHRVPRERLIAIITNNFVPCNGRFPTLIAIITMFFCRYQGVHSLCQPLLTLFIVLSVFLTLIISKLLSMTVSKGDAILLRSGAASLPASPDWAGDYPFRLRPDLVRTGAGQWHGRPAYGVSIWIMANVQVGRSTLLPIVPGFWTPLPGFLGWTG